MNRRSRITAFAVALAMLMLGVSVVAADSPRPTCDRGDSSSLCQASITVFTYVDNSGANQCDSFFDSGIDAPLSGARLTFVMPDGSRIQKVSGFTGYLYFTGVDFLPGDEAFLEIEYPAKYRDATLLPCSSSPVRRRITRESFGSFRSAQIHFCAHQHRISPASD